MADGLLFRVEQAVNCTNAYVDISEAFYTSTGSAYGDALKLMKTHKLNDYFQDRYAVIRR